MYGFETMPVLASLLVLATRALGLAATLASALIHEVSRYRALRLCLAAAGGWRVAGGGWRVDLRLSANEDHVSMDEGTQMADESALAHAVESGEPGSDFDLYYATSVLWAMRRAMLLVVPLGPICNPGPNHASQRAGTVDPGETTFPCAAA
jgi:hypothetical protein